MKYFVTQALSVLIGSACIKAILTIYSEWYHSNVANCAVDGMYMNINHTSEQIRVPFFIVTEVSMVSYPLARTFFFINWNEKWIVDSFPLSYFGWKRKGHNSKKKLSWQFYIKWNQFLSNEKQANTKNNINIFPFHVGNDVSFHFRLFVSTIFSLVFRRYHYTVNSIISFVMQKSWTSIIFTLRIA